MFPLILIIYLFLQHPSVFAMNTESDVFIPEDVDKSEFLELSRGGQHKVSINGVPANESISKKLELLNNSDKAIRDEALVGLRAELFMVALLKSMTECEIPKEGDE
tara:strand:+ start:119 stop:436 length:318 start_codon:yes stop_codon:yes gene_type:complete